MENMERNDKGYIRKNCITRFDSKYVCLGDVCLPVYDWNYFFDKGIDTFKIFYQLAAIDTSREDCYGLVRIGRDRQKESIVWAKALYKFGTFQEMILEGAKGKVQEIFEWQDLWKKL